MAKRKKRPVNSTPEASKTPETPVDTRALRFAAELYYTNDLFGRLTLAQLIEEPQFAGLALSTVQTWCAEDGWIAKRHERQQQLRLGIEEHLAQKLMQQNAEHLRAMDRLLAKSLALAMDPNGPAPKSFEGVARVAVLTSKAVNEVRATMLRQVLPEPAADPDAPETTSQPTIPPETLPTISDEESRGMALALLEMRQRQATPEPESK